MRENEKRGERVWEGTQGEIGKEEREGLSLFREYICCKVSDMLKEI